MPFKKSTNFAARFEYLSAVQEHWTEILKSLHRDTFPAYQKCLERNQQIAAVETLAGLYTATQSRASPEVNEFDRALRVWADTHHIRDVWIWDAAIQSMRTWAHGGTVAKWMYLADELNTPRFQPSFGHWIPQFTGWPAFKRVTDATYRRELAQYREHVRMLWGEGQLKLSQQAVWTVLWQQGKSPEAIRNKHSKMTGIKVSRANIQKRVHEFAASTGLTLRDPKAGPKAKRI